MPSHDVTEAMDVGSMKLGSRRLKELNSGSHHGFRRLHRQLGLGLGLGGQSSANIANQLSTMATCDLNKYHFKLPGEFLESSKKIFQPH